MSDSNATITRTNLIKRAFRRIGVMNPTTADMAIGVDELNDLMKRLDSVVAGLHAVSKAPTALTLVTSQASYATGTTSTTIAKYIKDLVRVEMMSGTSIQYELEILPAERAISTWNRDGSVTGQPVEVHLERAANPQNQKMWFYPTPSAAYSVQYYYRRRLYDFDSASDNPDMPPEHNSNLAIVLANQLAPQYGVTEDRIIAYHDPLAQRAEQEMRAFNREDFPVAPLVTEYF